MCVAPETHPDRTYNFSVLVAGQTESHGGHVQVHYDNGGSDILWHTNSGSYNSPNGTVQSNEFTLPTDAGQFRFSYRVRLDKGWLAFSDLKLTGWSDTIPVTSGEQYELSLHLAGELQALAEQGGQVMVHYDSGSPIPIWQNPPNFNSGGINHSHTFTPPVGAAEMQISYQVTMDKGRLAFSEAALSHLNPAYTITRKTYALGGQTIATRISGDQEGESDGLYYIHSDHLGSTSVMSYGQGHGSNSGNKVDDSTARYLPFGDWRVEPAHELTDQGFTGQKHNMDLGLYYYNARFYLPGIGRFATADTLVPDPMNPQQFNRYTYTLNNPLRFTDPTGHCAGDPGAIGECYGYGHSPEDFVAQINNLSGGMYQVNPTGWSDTELLMLLQAVGQIMSGLERQSGSAAGAKTLLANLMGNESVSIRRAHIDGEAGWGWNPDHRTIYAFSTSTAPKMAWSLAHETGHVIEGTWASATEFMQFTGGAYNDQESGFLMTQFGYSREQAQWAAYIPGSLSRRAVRPEGPGSWTYNARRHPSEDLAETMAYGLLCGTGRGCGAARAAGNNIYPGTVRMDYYQQIINRVSRIGR